MQLMKPEVKGWCVLQGTLTMYNLAVLKAMLEDPLFLGAAKLEVLDIAFCFEPVLQIKPTPHRRLSLTCCTRWGLCLLPAQERHLLFQYSVLSFHPEDSRST